MALSPPDADLSCFPITPPVDPACANATCCWAAPKSPSAAVKINNRQTLHFIGNPPFPPIVGENLPLFRPAHALRAIGADGRDDTACLALLVAI